MAKTAPRLMVPTGTDCGEIVFEELDVDAKLLARYKRFFSMEPLMPPAIITIPEKMQVGRPAKIYAPIVTKTISDGKTTAVMQNHYVFLTGPGCYNYLNGKPAKVRVPLPIENNSRPAKIVMYATELDNDLIPNSNVLLKIFLETLDAHKFEANGIMQKKRILLKQFIQDAVCLFQIPLRQFEKYSLKTHPCRFDAILRSVEDSDRLTTYTERFDLYTENGILPRTLKTKQHEALALGYRIEKLNPTQSSRYTPMTRVQSILWQTVDKHKKNNSDSERTNNASRSKIVTLQQTECSEKPYDPLGAAKRKSIQAKKKVSEGKGQTDGSVFFAKMFAFLAEMHKIDERARYAIETQVPYSKYSADEQVETEELTIDSKNLAESTVCEYDKRANKDLERVTSSDLNVGGLGDKGLTSTNTTNGKHDTLELEGNADPVGPDAEIDCQTASNGSDAENDVLSGDCSNGKIRGEMQIAKNPRTEEISPEDEGQQIFDCLMTFNSKMQAIHPNASIKVVFGHKDDNDVVQKYSMLELGHKDNNDGVQKYSMLELGSKKAVEAAYAEKYCAENEEEQTLLTIRKSLKTQIKLNAAGLKKIPEAATREMFSDDLEEDSNVDKETNFECENQDEISDVPEYKSETKEKKDGNVGKTFNDAKNSEQSKSDEASNVPKTSKRKQARKRASDKETTDMKKNSLTTNGVLVLYNSSTSTPVKVQVVFAMEWCEQVVARVSDGKFISPVVRFPHPTALRKDIYVGYIITVKQAKLVSTEMDQCAVLDYQIPHLQIEDYSLSERCDFLHGDPSACTDYWACLRRVGTHLSKFDKSFQLNMEREQARMTANETTANQLRERGNSLYKLGLYEKSIRCYQCAAKKRVYDDRIYANQALANIQLEKFDLALLLSKYAVKNNPFNVKAYYRGCHCCEREDNEFELFLMARACKVVCGETSDMEKYRPYVDKFSIEIAAEIAPAKLSAWENNILRSRSLSVAGRSVPETKKSAAGKVKQRDKSAMPFTTTTTAPVSAKLARPQVTPPVASKSMSSPAKHSISEDDAEQQEKRRLDAVVEKKKKEEEGVLAPGFSDSGKDVALVSLLKEARKFLREGSYGQALEFYATAIETGLVNHRGRKEQQLVSLVMCLCRVEAASVTECVAAIPSLKELLQQPTQDPDAVLPRAPIHYLLAMAHYHTWQSNEVTTHATECHQWLKKEKNKLPLFLPGFKDTIVQTEVSFLQSWFSDGAWRKEDLLQVVAKCRYQDCDQLKGTGHYRNIIKRTVLYSGHVDLSCEEDCNIYYHPSCWRIVKEELAENEKTSTGTKPKLGDKDFLNRACLTPDCNGLIISLNIYEESGEVKEFHTKDRNASSKQKKKKNKKKVALIVQYNKNKGKGTISKDSPADEEDVEGMDGKGKESIDDTDKVSNISKGMSKPGGNLPLDELDFDNDNIKILKPESNEKPDNIISKKNRKKNKKQRAAVTLETLLPSPLDSASSEQNEYVAKIRRLNAQKEALEDGSFSATPHEGVEDGPVLDPSKPYYTPQHLHDAPDTLKRLFADRTNPVSEYQLSRFAATNITQDAVHALLSFMYDFIKSEGPINVDDSKLKDYMIENFPAESTKYVQDCGGLRKFLLRSVDFALLDDIICIKEHVIVAQKQVVDDLREKFRTNKYTLSDKFRAQKLYHLIEDSKLSPSSSSSSLLSSNNSTSWSLSNGSESVAAPSLSHSHSFNSDFFNPANSTVIASSTDPNVTLVNDGSSAADKASRDSVSLAPSACVGSSSDVSQLDQFEPPLSCGTPRRPSAVNMASTPRKHSVTGLEDSPADLDVSTHRLFEVTRDDAGLAAEAAELALAVTQEKLQQALRTLAQREQQLQQEVEAKNDLQDKLAQVRNKMKGELTTLKKQRVNEEETAQAERRRTEQLKSQLTAEQRRVQGEKHKLVEENKQLLSKVNALQLHNDQLSHQASEQQTQVDQLTVSSSRLEDQLSVVQASLSSAADRARKAEQGYIDLNKSLTEQVIKSIQTASRYEVFTMRELERHATADTWPNARLLGDSRRDVEEHIRKLDTDLANLGTMSEKFSSMLNAGRPLSSLPRQNLPSVPENLICTKAIYLLNVSPSSGSASRPQSQRTTVTPPSSEPSVVPQPAPLASSSIDSGTASSHSSPGANGAANSDHAAGVDGARKKTDPVNGTSAAVPDRVNQLLRSLGMGSTSKDNSGAAKQSASNGMRQVLLSLNVNTPSKNSSACAVVTSGSHSSRSGVPAASSPEPLDPNPLTSDAHKLFVGKLPPSFTSEQLKTVFARYGHVYSARVADVPISSGSKFGIVAFVNTHDRDMVLRRVEQAPMTYGTSVLNVQPLNSALQRKTEDARRVAALSLRLTATPPPRPSVPNPRHVSGPCTGSDVSIELDIKPNFQNMRPVVRPEAAVGAGLTKKPMMNISSSGRHTTTAAAPSPQTNSYHRLAEKCRIKLGIGHSDDSLMAAISEVRRLNNGSLTGLAEDTIVDRVEQMLKRPLRRQNPWANLTPVMQPATLPHEVTVDVRDEECCICVCVMDKPSDVMRLDCGHHFHTTCINKWLSQKRDCPICRKHTINKEDYPSLSSAK